MNILPCIVSALVGIILGFLLTDAYKNNVRKNQGIPQYGVIEKLRKDCEAELPRNKICLTEAVIELKIVDRVE